jgi:hypothetical protein
MGVIFFNNFLTKLLAKLGNFKYFSLFLQMSPRGMKTPCKISDSLDNPFSEKSNPRRRKREITPLTVAN